MYKIPEHPLRLSTLHTTEQNDSGISCEPRISAPFTQQTPRQVIRLSLSGILVDTFDREQAYGSSVLAA
jgi:hypothetical protein